MTSRLRSWDDSLERSFARLMPSRWGPYDGPGAGMVGVGLASLSVGLLLTALLALAGGSVVVPLANAVLGLSFLLYGIRRNRRT